DNRHDGGLHGLDEIGEAEGGIGFRYRDLSSGLHLRRDHRSRSGKKSAAATEPDKNGQRRSTDPFAGTDEEAGVHCVLLLDRLANARPPLWRPPSYRNVARTLLLRKGDHGAITAVSEQCATDQIERYER